MASIEHPGGLDHPIFSRSIARIRRQLGDTGLEGVQQEVLERLVHSSGDLSIGALLRFSPGACKAAITALRGGATILTDTAMAAAAVVPMARRTFANPVICVLDLAPATAPEGSTRSAEGMERTLAAHGPVVVLIGSAPTALERLLTLWESAQVSAPALVIGMPVGFVGVEASKRHLAASGLPQIRLEGSRGGAGLAAATVNALLRRGWLDQAARGAG